MKQTKYEVQTVKKDNYNNTFDYILVDTLSELFRSHSSPHTYSLHTYTKMKIKIDIQKCFKMFPQVSQTLWSLLIQLKGDGLIQTLINNTFQMLYGIPMLFNL